MSKKSEELLETFGSTKRIRDLTDKDLRKAFQVKFETRHKKTKFGTIKK